MATARRAASDLAHMQLSWHEDDSPHACSAEGDCCFPSRFLLVHKEHEEERMVPLIVELIRWIVDNVMRARSSSSSVSLVIWVHTSLKEHLEALLRAKDQSAIRYWADDTQFYRDGDESKQINDYNISNSNSNNDSNFPSTSIDLIISLGGDGTVLKAAWLFQGIVPPILPFHLGTLGFLTVFDFDQFPSTLDRVLRVSERRTSGPLATTTTNEDHPAVRVNIRMRLECVIVRVSPDGSTLEPLRSCHVLNEIVIERGPSPVMATLELVGDGLLLTTVHADGLIIATPTGSTAYSLSAGGPLVHPGAPALLVTPICPHTLSFRPFMLPDTMGLQVSLGAASRATAWVSFDGRARFEIGPDERVLIQSSAYPVPTVCFRDQTADWFGGLSRCLFWNERYQKSPLA